MKSPIIIAVNGKSKCTIEYNEFKAAGEILAKYLNKITGGEFTLLKQNSTGAVKIIFTKKDHGHDGFKYYIDDVFMFIEATDSRAAIYAVYDFLERIIGCRFYTSEYEFVPKNANLQLSFDDYSFKPILKYRELYYRDYSNSDFAMKHKMNTTAKSTATNAQTEGHEDWGFWCHSFYTLCNPEEYFDEHPEYFSLRNGERLKEGGQLCLSNPQVLEIVSENLKKYVAEKPNAKYWSVSQNDNGAFCECDACRALDEADGGPMGSILNFVNKVAERFPDKVISTLAYWYSRKPPLKTMPAENVHIMLCNIEANRGLPIENDPLSKESKEELLAWKKICKNVFLWDYNIQFKNLVNPFPNLNTLAPNMRFFVENNVTSLFSQCNRERGGEFCELRGYMLAKLMWDPYLDETEIAKEFIYGYYHQAAEYIFKYIKLLHETKSDKKLSIFGTPVDGADNYLSNKNLKTYFELFAKAFKAVEHDAEAYAHVRSAKLPLLYAAICLKYGNEDERLRMIAEFASICHADGIEMVEEWSITSEKFISDSAAEIKLKCE